MKQPKLIVLLCALCVSVVQYLPAQPADAPVLPLSDLRPGMKGEVWTVFKGRAPEPFAVQVTGILQNALGPGKSMILCELTDPRVQGMGAVAGMSGSPLYIDGKVVGVLSYQIQRFETVRYAGFTPISDMLEVSALPSGKDGLTPTPIPVKGERQGTRGAGDFAASFTPMTPAFSLGGLAPEVAAMFEPQFSALGLNVTALGGNLGNGDAAAPAPAALHPGDVVAVALATGDISLAGTGTVSHVAGNRILAFGHPMLSLGATELPMASAEVVTILAELRQDHQHGRRHRFLQPRPSLRHLRRAGSQCPDGRGGRCLSHPHQPQGIALRGRASRAVAPGHRRHRAGPGGHGFE